MAVTIQTVSRGTIPGDGTGDTAYVSTGKINQNFTNLKAAADLILDVPETYFIGRVSTGAGDAEKLTPTQATALLNTFTSTLKGLVPLSGGAATDYLCADGTWKEVAAGLDAAADEQITGLWNFKDSGLGDLSEIDVTIGTVTDYGIAQIGSAIFGRTSHTVTDGAPAYNIDGAFIFQNSAGPVTGEIEFGWLDSTGLLRFGLPKSAVGNATYNPRSMLCAGPAIADSDIVTVGYWQTQGIFHNLTCDTGTSGADLGVQNDLEVEGDIFVDSILESTTAAGVTIDGVLLKDSKMDWSYISNAPATYAPSSHTLLSHTITGETAGHVLAADSATTYSIRQLLGSEINNDQNWSATTGTVTAVNNGDGMNFTNITGSGTVTLGTPSALTATSTDAVTTSSHTHSIDSTIARTSAIPDNTDFVDLTTAQTVAGVKTFSDNAVFDTTTAGGSGSGIKIADFELFPFSSGGSTAPTLRSATTNTDTILRVMGNGTGGGQFEFFGVDYFTSPSTWDAFRILTGTTYTLDTAKGASGTARPLQLMTPANTGQILLNIDGSVSMSGALGVTGAVTGSNLSGTNTGDNATNTQYSGLVSDTGVPAMLSSGGLPVLNTGITAAEYRSAIGAGTSSTVGTVTSVATTGAITGGTFTTSGTIAHSTAAGYKHIPTGGATGQWLKYSASGTAAWTDLKWNKSLTIDAPVSGDNVIIFFTPDAYTISEIRLVAQGTSPSCVVNLYHGTSIASGTLIDTNTVTSTTTGHDVTSISNTAIPANGFVWATIGTTTNTNAVHITLAGTIND